MTTDRAGAAMRCGKHGKIIVANWQIKKVVRFNVR